MEAKQTKKQLKKQTQERIANEVLAKKNQIRELTNKPIAYLSTMGAYQAKCYFFALERLSRCCNYKRNTSIELKRIDGAMECFNESINPNIDLTVFFVKYTGGNCLE